MKKFFAVFNLAFFSLLLGVIISSFTGISPYVAAPSVTVLTIASSQFISGSGYAWSSQDLSAIARYAHQFQRQLIVTLLNGLDAVNDFILLPGIKTSMKLPKFKAGAGARPYSATTEFYTGNNVFSDREIKVDVGKKEILIDPEDFRQTYLSLVMSPGSGAKKMDIPFAQYVWQEFINKFRSEINDNVVWAGFDKSDASAYSESATYDPGEYITYSLNGITEYYKCIAGATTTAGEDPEDTPAKWQKVTASAIAVGLQTILDADITAGDVVETATGVIDNTSGYEAYAAFLKLFRAFDPAYKNAGIITHCSFTDFELLLDDLNTQFQYTVTDMSKFMVNGMLPLPGTNGKGYVKPATWLGSSRRLIAEPVDVARGKGVNLVMGTDLLSDLNEIKTKENLWTLEGGIKFVCGFQISDLDAIKVGDQA